VILVHHEVSLHLMAGGFETPQEGASFESSCGQNDAWNARVANG